MMISQDSGGSQVKAHGLRNTAQFGATLNHAVILLLSYHMKETHQWRLCTSFRGAATDFCFSSHTHTHTYTHSHYPTVAMEHKGSSRPLGNLATGEPV